MNFTNSLILSPHVDDEVLGCFSFLSDQSFVLYFGIDKRPAIPKTVRVDELEASVRLLGFEWRSLDHSVNAYQASELIPDIEAAINSLKPQVVLLPEPSYNQDHRAVYDAGIVATRPHDTNWFVPRVLIFEQPHSVMWPNREPVEPTYFREVDIDKKLQAYGLYESQVRQHRSPETVRALAKLRGSQVCVDHAEAFRVKRYFDDFRA